MTIPGMQSSMEYGGTAVRDMLRWPSQAFQEYWYFVLGAILLLVILWGYSRK